jgi:hypothetical protein
VADTPTTRIASASLGQVEIVGIGVPPPGERLISLNSGLPCLYYHSITEEISGLKRHRIDESISTETFGIDDGTGMALIDRDEAEIITSHKQVTTKGQYRHTQSNLMAREALHVLGEHATIVGSSSVLDIKEGVTGLLTEWKRDQAGLLRRFNLNGDDSISMAELEMAREVSKQKVGDEHRKTRLHPGTHL